MNRPLKIAASTGVVIAVIVVAFIATREPPPPGGTGFGERPAVDPADPDSILPAVLDRSEIESILRAGPVDERFHALMAKSPEVDDEVADILLRFVEDTGADLVMRDMSLGFLVQCSREDIGERLVDVLASDRHILPSLEFRILETLRDRHDEDQIPRLTALIEATGGRADTVWMKSEAIRWLGGEAPLDALRRLASDDDPNLRGAAAVALIYAQGPGVSDEVDALLRGDQREAVRHEALRLVARRGTPESDRYLAGLIASDDADPRLRMMAAEMITTISDSEASSVILRVVADGTASDEILMAAAVALERAKPEGVARSVRATLVSGARPGARIAAAEAVRCAGDREGLPDVRRALTDGPSTPPGVRAALARALGEIGGRVDKGTLESLAEDDPDADVRRAAEEGLRRLEEVLLSNPDR